MVSLSTPGNVSVTLRQASGGEIELATSSHSIKIDAQGITLKSSAKVTVQAPKVDVSAAQVSVDAAMSNFSGIVRCDVLQTTTCIATTYTPGAGNVW